MYTDYLQSTHWKRKRLQVYSRRKKQCSICKSTNNLNVHHKTYTRLGKEKLSDLVILCQRCHYATHDFHKENKHLQLFAATNLYALMVNNPQKYQIHQRQVQKRREKKAEKRLRKVNPLIVQEKENEFNRRKLARFNKLGITA